MQTERRSYQRYEIQQMVKISFGIETISYTRGIDISKSGLLCETDQKLEEGQKIYCIISIPDKLYNDEKKKVEIQAEVVRVEKVEDVEKYRIALNFIFIEKSSKKMLYDYIDEIEKET